MEEQFLDDQGSLQNSPVDVYMFFSISRPMCFGISNAYMGNNTERTQGSLG